jgi:hypothetical protein
LSWHQQDIIEQLRSEVRRGEWGTPENKAHMVRRYIQDVLHGVVTSEVHLVGWP